MDEQAVQAWLDAYVEAWRTYDESLIADLFTEDAMYWPSPYDVPLRGRNEIVRAWTEEPDAPESWRASYEPLLLCGYVAVAHGTSTYFATGTEPEREWANIFVLRFDDQGRCSEYREWYHRRPDGEAPGAG